MLVEPLGRALYYVCTGPGEPITGTLDASDVMGVNPDWVPITAEDENDLLALLDPLDYPALPDAGWLETGDIYDWEGQAVMVRQSHNRTIYPPNETPALFVVYRPDGGTLDWIANELVTLGQRRIYAEIEYQCLQSHVTQADWTPPATPALWAVVLPPSSDWQPYTAYAVDDEVGYLGSDYKCLQAHTSLPGWEPPNVPALWQLIPPPGNEWQPWTWYARDDEVTYLGLWYRCLQAHTSQPGWEPPNVPALWQKL